MNNLAQLKFNLNNNEYYENWDGILTEILENNGLDALDEYSKENDQIEMLECVYDALQTLANDVNSFLKVQTEFTTISAGYTYLQKRLKDIREDIDRLKEETRLEDGISDGRSRLTSYMFFNGR